jgi:hypothetical protein
LVGVTDRTIVYASRSRLALILPNRGLLFVVLPPFRGFLLALPLQRYPLRLSRCFGDFFRLFSLRGGNDFFCFQARLGLLMFVVEPAERQRHHTDHDHFRQRPERLNDFNVAYRCARAQLQFFVIRRAPFGVA